MNIKNIPHIKCVLLGDANVGKTSIITRYLRGEFCEFSESTIGCSFNNKLVETSTYKYKLDLWDTAGQERYRGLMPMYYRNADLILLCIDLSEKNTEKMNTVYNYWKSQVSTHNDNPNKIILLIGTKSDCKVERTEEELRTILDENEFKLYETSAKDDIGINNLFNDAVNMVNDIKKNKIEINENKDINKKLVIKNDKFNSYLSLCNIL